MSAPVTLLMSSEFDSKVTSNSGWVAAGNIKEELSKLSKIALA